MAPAERWPYEPVALELRDAFMMDVRELGEKRIMELMSNVSEYGDEDSGRFRPCTAPADGLRNMASCACALYAARRAAFSTAAAEL